MSEQAPDRPGEHARDPQRRPAPPGYGVPSAAHLTDASGGRRASTTTVPTPSTTAPDTAGNPVYGRVTRFGTPGTPGTPGSALAPPRPAASGPPPTEPYTPVGPPAPWPTTSEPSLGSASPYPSPPGPGQAAPPLPWAAPPPPWATPAPRPWWSRDEYASWGRRVASDLVDRAPAYVALVLILTSYLPLYVGLFRGDPTAQPTWSLFVVGMLLSLASTGWTIWNRWFVAGRTGQSLGKRVTRTWLVSTVDGRPVGVLNAFLRDLLHVLDGLGYVGYLWPLWDEQRQTLADKVVQTVVVRTPVPPLTDAERASRP